MSHLCIKFPPYEWERVLECGLVDDIIICQCNNLVFYVELAPLPMITECSWPDRLDTWNSIRL